MNDNKPRLSRHDAMEIINKQAWAYKQADKLGKKQILNSLEYVLKRNRKSLIRSINHVVKTLRYNNGSVPDYIRFANTSKKEARGRPRKYTKEVEAALAEIWDAYGCICAERLYPQISIAINIFRRDRDWSYSDNATNLLLRMPLGTMKYYLVRFAKDRGLMRGFSTTRASSLLDAIPIFHGDWSNMPVGYGQLDTVVHSGPRLEGIMAYTVSFIEMQTYWQEFYAELGKTAEITRFSLSRIAQRLPMKLVGIHSDSGDEFVNKVVLAWCRSHHIDFTRSRPHEKNDNANVEERNRHVVREYVGYERYDCIEAVDALNSLYKVLRLYINYFQPIMKIQEKTYLPNGKQIRKYEQAKTPYERVLEHPEIPADVKEKLTAGYQTLNPKKLRATIQALTINLERIQKEQGYHFNSEEVQ